MKAKIKIQNRVWYTISDKDKAGGADVIFGEKGDSILLGAFTLEALGMTLDPLKRELKPLPMVLGQSVCNTSPNIIP